MLILGSAIFHNKLVPNYGVATKTSYANGAATYGTQLRGMRHTESHFCLSPIAPPLADARGMFRICYTFVLNVRR
jgi:hypothetical protein